MTSAVRPVRKTPLDAEEQVAALPRRTAHAAFALLETAEQLKSPAKVSEIIFYDPEALTTRDTARALVSAQKKGLVEYWGGGIWVPSLLGYDLRTALENRFLAETAREGEEE